MKMKSCLIIIVFCILYLVYGGREVNASETLYFLHQDHLGSTVLSTSEKGEVISKQTYYPYGSTRTLSGTGVTEKRYTGQVSDTDETGLYYYNARYYNPTLAKFTQADEVSNSVNKYAYVYNNPLRFNDPTGNMDWDMLSEGVPQDISNLMNYSHRDLLLSDFSPISKSLNYKDRRTINYSIWTNFNSDNLLKISKTRQPEEEQSLNPFMVEPQSSVIIQSKRDKDNNTVNITITVVPNPRVNIAIDPFMKIILPKGVSMVSDFKSNQTGWGQNYYEDTNTYLIDNYNISYGNSFTLAFQMNVNRGRNEGKIKVETWSDLYYFDESHDQILQSVSKIPMTNKRRNN